MAEKIDGSAFVDGPLIEIGITPGSPNFNGECNLLIPSKGTEMVRYFGREFEVILPVKVELLGKSWFEACDRLEILLCEDGSKLGRISGSALSNCTSLRSISIPASIEMIGKAALKD
jgi:hypothetical protein